MKSGVQPTGVYPWKLTAKQHTQIDCSEDDPASFSDGFCVNLWGAMFKLPGSNTFGFSAISTQQWQLVIRNSVTIPEAANIFFMPFRQQDQTWWSHDSGCYEHG